MSSSLVDAWVVKAASTFKIPIIKRKIKGNLARAELRMVSQSLLEKYLRVLLAP